MSFFPEPGVQEPHPSVSAHPVTALLAASVWDVGQPNPSMHYSGCEYDEYDACRVVYLSSKSVL